MSLALLRSQPLPRNTPGPSVVHGILKDIAFAKKFLVSAADHIKVFSHEATCIIVLFQEIWTWAHDLQNDALCAEFLDMTRRSAPLWNRIFALSEYPPDVEYKNAGRRASLASMVVCQCRQFASEKKSTQMVKIWVSAGILERLEADLKIVVNEGTFEEQVCICRTSLSLRHSEIGKPCLRMPSHDSRRHSRGTKNRRFGEGSALSTFALPSHYSLPLGPRADDRGARRATRRGYSNTWRS